MRDTSIEAHKKSVPKAFADRKIITLMLQKKLRGTGAQIAQWAKLDYHAVMRRMSELVSSGVVKGEKRAFCPIKNKKVTLWELV